ncbi:hypothetical protein [Salinibacter grassmerensis]|uniref:hypothetical protein n=1 Tax=Salinibacter grassmerensis TaxID=3040353 RepID=UPI0021E8C7B5|nr:hypothetical protein [Salinibacter grassmerensis]
MTVAECIRSRGPLLIVLLAGVVWTSCDLASAGNTVILSANSPPSIEPTVQHRFEYEKEAVVDGRVAVESEIQLDSLDNILSRNGFGRSDVVDARIDSVEVNRESAPSLTDADVFLGTSADGPRVAQVASFPDGASSVVDDTSTPVREAVQNRIRTLHGRFGLERPDDGVVRAKVYYRLKVEGV